MNHLQKALEKQIDPSCIEVEAKFGRLQVKQTREITFESAQILEAALKLNPCWQVY